MISQIYDILKNKKILILGYGREGKSSYNLIRQYYPDIFIGIYDKNEIKDSLQNVTIHCGDSYQDILADYDLIIKSPGIVFYSKNSRDYKKLTSQTDIFLSIYRNQTIGITGTKGKSTTSSLIYHVLKTAAKDVLLAGNIGIPVFDKLDLIKEETLVVYEMSSHQLEYAGYSPHIGLHLNIYQEHLDHYGTFENYAAAKENIFKHQQKGDLFIYNKHFLDPAKKFKADTITITDTGEDADMFIRDNCICFKGRRLKINEDEILLKGHHNLYNIGAAYCVADYFGISDELFYIAVKTFKPLPHRMEFVGEVEGVRYFNDSISTCCETTIQAINSIKNIDTVILGGMDRGIEYKPLVDFLMTSQVSNLILMPDIGQRIYNLIITADEEAGGKKLFMVAGIEEAVNTAKEVTKKGMTCLFSPAAASYGFFKNFEERGNIFKKYVLS